MSGHSLAQINIGEVFATVESLSLVSGVIDVPADGAFTAAGSLGGYLKHPLSARPATVATLTLHVTGMPGTYTLGLSEGTYGTAGEQVLQMETGAPFTITVQGP